VPFKSNAQRAKFLELVKSGKMSQATFDRWESETPSDDKLPDRVAPSGGAGGGGGKVKSVKKARVIK